ncbi:MAG: IS110 family transposase [Gammaproteobacteria bacterium]
MRTGLHVAVDVGSRFHQVAVGDAEGSLLELFKIDHQPAGLDGFFSRIERHHARCGGEIRVAMEGYNGWARPLDQQVLAHGWRLFNVNNLKLARYKEIFPAPAKTDAIDARRILELFSFEGHSALARTALQEVPPIPEAHRRLKYLTRRRRQLVEDKALRVTRLQGDLQALSPGLLSITGAADNLWFLRFLTCRDSLSALARLRSQTLLNIVGVGQAYCEKIQTWQRDAQFSVDIEFADADIIEDARAILARIAEIKTMNARIADVLRQSVDAQRVRSIPGFGPTGTAELIGEIGVFARFTSEASLAVYVGMAPLDHSSGMQNYGRRPHNINTRCQNALMTCVARHMACVPESRAYYDRKRDQGKTHNQAVRALGRHLVRVIWNLQHQQRDYEIRSKVEVET